MLLEDVIKNTPDNHADKANLDEALQQIESVAWHINDQLREHENALKMLDIQRSLQVGGYKDDCFNVLVDIFFLLGLLS